ncbi:hypothetical protein QQ045_016114 [Rhodiola kirilowii]
MRWNLHTRPLQMARLSSIMEPGTVTLLCLRKVIRSNVTYICLVNTGLGTPFISAIELRPLISGAYETQHDTIALQQRLDFGNEVKRIRFPDDAYDRIYMDAAYMELIDDHP